MIWTKHIRQAECIAGSNTTWIFPETGTLNLKLHCLDARYSVVDVRTKMEERLYF